MDTCNHTKANGIPCGSPSLTGSPLCYFHGRILDRALRNPEGPMILAALDSSTAVLAALSQLTLAIASNSIDLKRAGILLRALTLAARLSATVARATEAEAAAIQQAKDAAANAPEPAANAPEPAAWTIPSDPTPAETPTQVPQLRAAATRPRHPHTQNRLPRSQRRRPNAHNLSS